MYSTYTMRNAIITFILLTINTACQRQSNPTLKLLNKKAAATPLPLSPMQSVSMEKMNHLGKTNQMDRGIGAIPPSLQMEETDHLEKFDLCAFPQSLKKAVEKKRKADCAEITQADLTDITQLTLKHITKAEMSILSKEHSPYFTKLEDLDISDNPELQALPAFVIHLPALKKLNVSKTGINNFSESICRMEQLTELTASYNSYEGNEMPIALFCLSNLKKLDMSYSSLIYIDEYIFYLKNLEELYLKGNSLMAAPVVLHRMFTLLVLDLRDNQFEYESVNSLHNCKPTSKDSDERKNCQEELLDSVACEYWYEVPDDFERPKHSFIDRYEEMTGETHKVRSECIECARCYNSWLNNYVFYDDPDKRYLLDLTINGKTMREWRLAEDELIKTNSWSCQYDIKGISWRNGIGSSLYHFFFPRSTDYGPSSHEIHPERYRSPEWKHPEFCQPVNYNTPVPKNSGPWSKALPAVQKSLMEKGYLDPDWDFDCKNWPTSRCPETTSFLERFLPGLFTPSGKANPETTKETQE